MLTMEESAQYAERDAIVKSLGYSSYRTYLHSAIWKGIRHNVLLQNTRCRACGKKATQIHHNRYLLEDMNGKCLEHLIPVCGTCHRAAEFSKDGSKIGPQRATQKLNTLARTNTKRLQKRMRSQAWRQFFDVVTDMRIYLGMDDSHEAQCLVAQFDYAKGLIPQKK